MQEASDQPGTGTRIEPPSRASLVGPVGLLALTCAVFSSVLAGGLFFLGDFHGLFEPLREILSRELPDLLWNPSIDNGQPLLASPFSSALYPPVLAAAWLGGLAARAATLLGVLHVFWAALGTWLLLRLRGHRSAAAWTGAVVFAFNGAAVSATYMAILSSTAAWIPWMVWAVLRVLDAKEVRPRRLLPVVVIGLFFYLAGDPFMWLAGGLGILFLTSWPAAFAGGSRPRLLALAAAGAVTVLLASPHLTAASRVVASSVRGSGFSLAAASQLPILRVELLGLALPGLLGDLSRTGVEGFWAYRIQDGHAPLFYGTYVGLLSLALATTGALVGRRRCAAPVLWLATLLVLGLGAQTPLFEFLHAHLPGFSSLRFPGKWLLGALLPLALLVADGVAVLEGHDPGHAVFGGAALAWLLLPAAVSAGSRTGFGADAISRLLAAGAIPDWGVTQEIVRSHLLVGAAWAAAPLLLALVATRVPIPSRLVPPLVAGLGTLDLTIANPGLAPTTGSDYYRDPPAVTRAIRDDPGPHGRTYVEFTPEVATRVPGPGSNLAGVYRLRRERLDGHVGASYGLDLAFGGDVESLSEREYADLRSVVVSAPERVRVQALSIAGVTHLVTFREWTDPALRPIASIDVSADRPLRVYRNTAALPRIRVASRWGCVPGLVGFSRSLLLPGSDPEVVRLDRGDPGAVALCEASPRTPGPWAGTLVVRLDRSGSLAVETDGPRGLLVVSDTLAPGLRALVDGRAARLWRANVAFRAVAVPEGRHRIEIRYGPWS